MSDEVEPVQADSEPRPTTMLPRERQLGYALAGLGALFAVEAAVRGATPIGAVLGFVSAALLALAVRHGQRVITCFAALLAGFLLGGFLPLEVLYLLYSGYLMLRVSKAQGKINASRPRPTPRQRREAKVARAGAAKKGGPPAGPRASAVRQPAANRRYTPPKSKPGQK